MRTTKDNVAVVALISMFGVASLLGAVGMLMSPPAPKRADPGGASRPAGVSQSDWDYSVGRFQQQGMSRAEAEQSAGAVAEFDRQERERRRR